MRDITVLTFTAIMIGFGLWCVWRTETDSVLPAHSDNLLIEHCIKAGGFPVMHPNEAYASCGWRGK